MSNIDIKTDKPFIIKLTQEYIDVICTAIFSDKTEQSLEIDSVKILSAQREITNILVALGFRPVSRWIEENLNEKTRIFRPTLKKLD